MAGHGEKRRYSRLLLMVPVTLHLEDGTTYRLDNLEDVSIGGCRVPMREGFRVGVNCALDILLGSDIDLERLHARIEGQFVRESGGFLGIRFTGIDPDSLFLLQNLIMFNAPDPDRIDQEIQDHPGLL